MSIRIVCPSCQAALNVKDEYAGKRGKCPKCRVTVEIPEVTTETPAKQATPRIPPATERQKEYAIELGLQFDENINRRELSRLIDAAVEKRDEERYRRLEQLQERESEAWAKMREEVLHELNEEDPRLNNASPQDMVEEISNRGDAAIMITFDPDALDEIKGGKVPRSAQMIMTHSSHNMNEEDMRKVLMTVGVIILGQDVGKKAKEDSAS